MQLKAAALCAFVAMYSLASCKAAHDGPEIGSQLTRQPIQIVHYGDDGPLASIEGKPGLYGVVFDPDCQGCKSAEQAIEPVSVSDTSLCEFGLTVSGIIEKTYRELNGTLRIQRVDQQPNGRAGHHQGRPGQRCERQLSSSAMKSAIV